VKTLDLKKEIGKKSTRNERQDSERQSRVLPARDARAKYSVRIWVFAFTPRFWTGNDKSHQCKKPLDDLSPHVRAVQFSEL
jgi:hypothetical protein